MLKTLSEKSKWKRQFIELVMEKKDELMRFFARVDMIVGVLGSLGVHLPVEDVTLKIVEAFTADYELERRTIVYKDNITRAKGEAVVRQMYTIMSRRKSMKNRNVGQALVAHKPARRNRKQQCNGKGVAGKGVSGGVAVAKNDDSSCTKDEERTFDDMRNKYHRCLEPGHRWLDCNAHVIPTAKTSPNGSGDIIGCLAIGMLCKRDVVGEREKSKEGNEKWIADSGATFHMSRSTELLRDLHPS